jgi:hypothetical protein
LEWKKIRGILLFVGRKQAAKQDAKELLLAEMVYKAAVEKHRQEQSEISRRVVAEAYRQYMDMQRDVMVAAWDTSAQLVACPRCKKPTLAKRWVDDEPEGPAEDPPEGRRRPKRAVPDWAKPYADRGARRVTRYCCGDCGFEISLVE